MSCGPDVLSDYPLSDSEKSDQNFVKWHCHGDCNCKPLTDEDVDTIVLSREEFTRPMSSIRKTLQTCDTGCPNVHHSYLVHVKKPSHILPVERVA